MGNLSFSRDLTWIGCRVRYSQRGDVAQLGEHHVRNVGVVGSNPIISTILLSTHKTFR